MMQRMPSSTGSVWAQVWRKECQGCELTARKDSVHAKMAETEDAAWNREDKRKGEPTSSYKTEEEEKEKQVEFER